MIVPTLPTNKTKDYFLKIDKFRGGSNTLVNPARLKTDFAFEINNLWQVQDGIWKTRPGLAYYGEPISGATDIDGAIEIEKSDGTRQIIAIANNGYAYRSTDGGAWTQLSGGTFTPGNKPYFVQIGNKLFIANGVDNFTYYDGTSLYTYSPLSNPTAPTTSLTGLTTGGFTNYYRIVAVNSIGNTLPSNSTNQTTNKPRDQWNSSNYVSLSWSAVTGADGYQIFWGEFDGEENLIGESVATSFIDYGETTYPHNPYIETPDDNTTSAPKFKSMEISGNRMWATYDDNNKWRVYFTGTGQYFVSPSFSPFYGGGWIDLEVGGKNHPINVSHYRTGKGDPIITVFCTSADGNGTIFQIDLVTVKIGTMEAIVPSAYKIVGAVGADSCYGVVKALDNIFFPNKKGIFALRNKQQMFNVLSNDDMTAPIRSSYEGLNENYIKNTIAYYKAPRIYFSASTGNVNDTTFIFDLERNNWTWKWTVGFKQLFEYTDSSGFTHFIGVLPTGNRLVELSENFTSDYGEPFYQSYISPLIPISQDYTIQAKINEVIYELGSFRGTLTVELLGITKSGLISVSKTKEISSTTGTTGISDELFSDFLFSDIEGIPSVFTEQTTKKAMRINRKLYAYQFKIYTTSNNTSFELLGLQAKGYVLPTRSPSGWRN